MKLYVTYGYGSEQGTNYSVVEGIDDADCLRQINDTCSSRWAFCYREHEKAEAIDRYGLTEIPLQAQTRSIDRELHLHQMIVQADRQQEMDDPRNRAHETSYQDDAKDFQ